MEADTNRSISLLLLTVGGTAGIAALFLPVLTAASLVNSFTELWFLVIPFFLPVLVSVASARWMISGLLSRPERAFAYVAGSLMAFVTLFFSIDLLWLSSFDGWLMAIIPVLTLLFGVYVVIKNLRNKGPKEVSAVMAMQIAYISYALLRLIPIFGYWQIGAYFVVVTSGVYLTQIVLALVKLSVLRGDGASSSI
jgi:uncharacterized membrane protein (DUF2068 family)